MKASNPEKDFTNDGDAGAGDRTEKTATMATEKLCLETYLRATESPSNWSDFIRPEISQVWCLPWNESASPLLCDLFRWLDIFSFMAFNFEIIAMHGYCKMAYKLKKVKMSWLWFIVVLREGWKGERCAGGDDRHPAGARPRLPPTINSRGWQRFRGRRFFSGGDEARLGVVGVGGMRSPVRPVLLFSDAITAAWEDARLLRPAPPLRRRPERWQARAGGEDWGRGREENRGIFWEWRLAS